MSDSPGLDGVPHSHTVSNDIDMAEGYESRSFNPGAFRDTSTVFSSHSSSVVSSHSSASSLISFYAEAELPNQMALVPYISPELVPMQCRVIDSFKDRLSTWSEEEKLYFEHHNTVFTRLVTGDPPHFPSTGYTNSLRSKICHLSIIAPQYPHSYTRTKPVAADNEYELSKHAWGVYLTICFMYKETAEVKLGGEVFFIPITKFVFRCDSDLSFIEIYGTVANKQSFTVMVKHFRLPTNSECVNLRGQPLGHLEVLINCQSGRALYQKASWNMVEEEVFVLWLKTLTRNKYWSKDWFDFYSCFISSSAAAHRVWTPDFDACVEWAFYDLPDISWDVELVYGGLNLSGYWQGMVRWFHG
ncbi:hypothetical protein BT96DRAFT_944621 [Gymnopus androsaceus JB14]|uniref:Uncharacterized protein n=1 Tax=Gymnopus androsaceus JB14 TaxID=1447944 RepID=A0A6A4H409_9AGAR|nr:hypothetical protein BT96DRAFT_944621 [Gymnopus androsaceus JB14]